MGSSAVGVGSACTTCSMVSGGKSISLSCGNCDSALTEGAGAADKPWGALAPESESESE